MANSKTIEQEIADVFRKLVEEKPNASFVYSFVYATDKDIAKAKVAGRVNMSGSKEEVETHLEEIKTKVAEQTAKQQKKKDKIYGSK